MAIVNGKHKPAMRALSCKIVHWNCPIHGRADDTMQQIKCLYLERCPEIFIAHKLLCVCVCTVQKVDYSSPLTPTLLLLYKMSQS